MFSSQQALRKLARDWQALAREAVMTSPTDFDPTMWAEDFLMTRAQASAFAKALGISIATNTLAKLAVSGGGPPMTYFRRRPQYRVSEFRQWLLDRQRRAHSTSERPESATAPLRTPRPRGPKPRPPRSPHRPKPAKP